MRTDRETRRVPVCKFSLKMPQKPRNDMKSLKINDCNDDILITISQTI
jgi:hypothetical protein